MGYTLATSLVKSDQQQARLTCFMNGRMRNEKQREEKMEIAPLDFTGHQVTKLHMCG